MKDPIREDIKKIITKAVGKIHKAYGVDPEFDKFEAEQEAIASATEEILANFDVMPK
jgi:hypothetical protein